MAHPIHSERHFTGNQIVRDLVLGMADGLTVPFALAAGLTDPRRALRRAVTIGGGYAVGGLIPLWPYMILGRASTALGVSTVVTLCALAVFGSTKARFTGAPPLRSAVQTVIIGGLAAAVAFLIAWSIS